MKILPILLINLAVTGGALVIYDQMQGEAGSATYDMAGADSVAMADVETRLARLEKNTAAPALAGAGNEGILRRLEALEGSRADSGTRPSESGMASADGPAGSNAGPITTFSDDGDVSDGEVRRFRKLMDAANEQRRLEREREQLASLLERLEIEMDDKQQEQFLTARRARQEKMGQMFRDLRNNREPGGDREQFMTKINEGRAKLNEEFAVQINKFLPSGDAAKLVEHENSNRWGGMARGGPSARGGRGGR